MINRLNTKSERIGFIVLLAGLATMVAAIIVYGVQNGGYGGDFGDFLKYDLPQIFFPDSWRVRGSTYVARVGMALTAIGATMAFAHEYVSAPLVRGLKRLTQWVTSGQ